MKQKLLKTMLLLSALVVGSSNVWATEGDEITSIANIVDGQSYYIKGVRSSTTYYLTFTDATGSQSGTESSTTAGAQLITFHLVSTGVYTLETASGNFIAPGTANGKISVSASGVNVTASNQSSKIRLSITSSGTTWSIQKNTSAANFGGYKNTQTDITLIEGPSSGGGGGSTVATPSFDPVAGTYTTAQTVGISCDTEDATIYYTTDGTDPDDSSTEYSSPISITTSGTVLKAIAYKDGMTESSIRSATYTIKPNKPTISAAGATVTISGDDGLTFYYTTDGSVPSSASTEYTAPFDLAEDCTIKAKAYDTYGNASDATSAFTFKYMPLSPKNIGSGYYEKVTSVSSLENGDAILIVNETANVALSTTQNSNNRGQQEVTITTGTPNVIYAPSAKAQKLVLVKKTEKIDDKDTDVFYFYTGSGYLYAAGANSNNYMRTETTPDANNNARATISISSGDATITFKGSASRNLLQYNSGSKIFSCYGSAQQNVQIYKEVAHNESVTVTSAGYATIASPYALDFTDSDIDAYIATSSSASAVTLSAVNKVPANTGVLLKYTGGTTENIPVFDGTSADDVSENLLAVSNGSVKGGEGIYALANKTHGVGFYHVSSGLTIASGKVYLDLSESSVKEFLNFDFGGDNETAIESLTPALSEGKGYVYDLSGRRVQKPTKGLYIVNGKKIMF